MYNTEGAPAFCAKPAPGSAPRAAPEAEFQSAPRVAGAGAFIYLNQKPAPDPFRISCIER